MSVRTDSFFVVVNLGMLEWIDIKLLGIIPLPIRYLVKIHDNFSIFLKEV